MSINIKIHVSLILLFLLSSYSAECQNSQEGIIEVVTENYRGYIFGIGYPENVIGNEGWQYAPTLEDVKKVEELISVYIENEALTDSIMCFDVLADMKINLKNYIRQYSGYFIKNGDRVLVIDGVDEQLIKKHNREDRFKKYHWALFQMCALQWSFTINIETMEVTNFFYGG